MLPRARQDSRRETELPGTISRGRCLSSPGRVWAVLPNSTCGDSSTVPNTRLMVILVLNLRIFPGNTGVGESGLERRGRGGHYRLHQGAPALTASLGTSWQDTQRQDQPARPHLRAAKTRRSAHKWDREFGFNKRV